MGAIVVIICISCLFAFVILSAETLLDEANEGSKDDQPGGKS